MWLIDENLHTGLYKVLAEFGVEAKTVSYAGLAGVDNGALTRAAFEMGFTCILTQDRTFPRDAAAALEKTPGIAIVVIRIAQNPPISYLARFRDLFSKNPIKPIAGKVLEWG